MTTPTATDTPAEKPVVLPTLDDFGTMAVEKITGQINERNAIYKTLTAATGDRQGMLDELRATAEKGEHTDSNVNALAAKISDLLSEVYDLEVQRDKFLNAQIDATIEASGVDPAVAQSQIDALDAQIAPGLKYLTGIYGPEVSGYLPTVEGKRTRKTSATGGSGQRRIRGVEVYVDGKLATTPDNNGVQRSTFSAGAKALGLDSVKPLQDKYTERNGTDPDKFPEKDTFFFTTETGEHEVKVIKKA